MENRALGKGLSALIPPGTTVEESQDARTLKTDLITNNRFQPRKVYDTEKLKHLKASIQDKGVLQPILVRASKDGGYEVVAGERRLRAVRELNLSEVPVIIKDISDSEALAIALVENIQREELNPIEEAEAYKRLIGDFSYTQEQVAKAVGKERSTVTNLLRLLNLDTEIQQALASGKITVGHARALLGIEMSKNRIELCNSCIDKGLSVRELERLINILNEKNVQSNKVRRAKSHEILLLEESLRKVLGTKVDVQAKNKKGKIVIEYYSLDDLDRILKVIQP